MLDLAILLAFVAYGVAAGFAARRKASAGLDEYFLAGRTLAGWKAGASMAATQFAADTPLLVTGLIATAGVFALWRLWIYGVAFLLMGFLFAGHWQRAGVLTDAELTEVRYSGAGVLALRVAKALYYGTVINCVVLAMVLLAAVRIAEVFLPWHAWLPAAVYDPLARVVGATGVAIASGQTGLSDVVATTNNIISIAAMVGFTALYSMTGGLRSVVATDVAQLALALISTFVFAWFVLDRVGGLSGMTQRLVETYGQARAARTLAFAPGAADALAPFLALIGLQWIFQMNSDGTGYLAQRAMACRDERQARVAALVFAWAQIFLRSLPWLAIGLGLLILHPILPGEASAPGFAASREMLFVTGIDELLPPGARGLMLTGMLAALASTLDTHMNWGASYWANDIYKRLVCEAWLRRAPGRRELVVVARLSNLLVLAIAFVVMANLGSIQQAWRVSLLFGAGMGAVLVLRWLWERINLYSELGAMAVSLIAAPIVLRMVERDWAQIGVMALASTAAAVGAALLLPGTADVTLRAFYARVRPAGFWGRTARGAGDDPAVARRRLGREVVVTLLAATSLLGALYGVARLLFPLPGGSALPAWAALCVAAGASPFWWRAARAPTER